MAALPRTMRVTLLILLGLFLALSLFGMALPERAEVSRSLEIRAPAERIHALLDDFERWKEWNPLFEADQERKVGVEFGEQHRGFGGQMRLEFGPRFQVLFTIVVTDPDSGIEIETVSGNQDVDLWRAEGVPTLESVRFEPTADGTRVTWVQTGAKPPMLLQRTLEYAFGRRRIGKQIDAWLAALKAAAER